MSDIAGLDKALQGLSLAETKSSKDRFVVIDKYNSIKTIGAGLAAGKYKKATVIAGAGISVSCGVSTGREVPHMSCILQCI